MGFTDRDRARWEADIPGYGVNVNIDHDPPRNTAFATTRCRQSAQQTSHAHGTCACEVFSACKMEQQLVQRISILCHPTAVLPAEAESKQTCQSTCSPPHGSRSAGMVGVVIIGYDRVATAAASCKEKVPFGIDISPFSVSLPSSSPWLRQSSASWFVVKYGARALHHIGPVLGPASSGSAKGRPAGLAELESHGEAGL